MALFSYQAFSRDGKKQAGNIDAPSLIGARELLGGQGLYPITILPAHQAAKSENFLKRFFSQSVPLKDKIIFTKQLAVLLRSGVPLLQAMDLLDDQFTGRMHTVLVSIKDGLKEGQSLADGMKQYPRVFENLYIQLVRAGEASGKLEVILDRLVDHLERTEELKGRVTSALRQPLIQLCMVGLVVVFLMTAVVPQLAETFQGEGATLPLPTRILLPISNGFVDHYILLAISFTSLFTGFLYWKSTPSGALSLDRFKLQMPIVKTFARHGAVAEFCSTLGMLLESGVLFSQALDIVTSIVDNKILKQAISEARDKIVKQGKITQYLKQTNIFPAISLYLIGTGEESGNLDVMLLTVAANYEKELMEKADTLSALMQPIMMLIMAFIVGFIVLAIAIPMMQMATLVG